MLLFTNGIKWSIHQNKVNNVKKTTRHHLKPKRARIGPSGFRIFFESVPSKCWSNLYELDCGVSACLQVFAGGGQGRENCCDARYNLWYCSSAWIVGRCKKIQMMCCGLWTSDVLGYTPYCLTTCHRVSVSCFARCCFLTGHVGISRKHLGSKIFETRQCDCQGGCSTWNWPNRNRTTSQQRVVSASCETSRPSAGATWL